MSAESIAAQGVRRGLFDAARAVADAVLYEGYVLYPYRASSAKNRTRWQFGVLMPPAYLSYDSSERSATALEIVLEPGAGTALEIEARFLQAVHRSGGVNPEWDETHEQRIELTVPLTDVRASPVRHRFSCAGGEERDGAVCRIARPLAGDITVGVESLPGPYGALRLRVELANTTASAAAGRDAALREALIAAHVLAAVPGGRFVSMTDPPEWARPLVHQCTNEGLWPVLAGPTDAPDRVLLASPIILGDHPEIAPESPTELYDGTEIDEILTLRTMTLTEAEKAEARATDPRAAALIDAVDSLPPDQLDRLHGALRYLRSVTREQAGPPAPFGGRPGSESVLLPAAAAMDEVPTWVVPDAPWWDPGADASVDPATDSVLIDGVAVRRGHRVRMFPGGRASAGRPAQRRTDAQDVFLRGRIAVVEAVLHDVDGGCHVGVTPDDDAELAELTRWHGRFLYFAPWELAPVDVGRSVP